MAENDKARSDSDVVQSKVEFHYIKSNHFRVIHADGVYGGATPRGFIIWISSLNVALFHEK